MIRQRWGEVLEVIKRERRMSWALVSPYGQPGTLEGGVFSLLLPSAGLINTFDHGGHAEVVASALYQALGVQAQVRAVLSGGDGGPGGPGGGDGGRGPGGGPGGQDPQAGGGWGGAATTASASPTETAPADAQADGGSGWPPPAGGLLPTAGRSAGSGDRGAPQGKPHPSRSPSPGAEQNPFTRQAVRESPGRPEPEAEKTAAVNAESGARMGTGLSPAIRPTSQAAQSKPPAARPSTGSAASPGTAAGPARSSPPKRAPKPAGHSAPGGTSPARAASPVHAPSPASPAQPAQPLREGRPARGAAPAGAAGATGSAAAPSTPSKLPSSAVYGEDPGFNPWYEQESAWEAPPPPEDWFAPEDDAAWPVPGDPGASGAQSTQPARDAAPARPRQDNGAVRPTQGAAGSRPAQDLSWSGGESAKASPPEPGTPAPSSEPEPQLASVHRLHALPELPPTHPAVRARHPHITLAHRESQPTQSPRFSPLAPVSWNDPAQPPAAPEPPGTDAAPGPSTPASGAPGPSSPSAGRPSPASAHAPRPATARTAAQVRSLAARKPTVSLEEDLPSEDDEDAEEAGAVGIEVVKRLLGAVVIEEVVVTQEGS